MILENFKKYIGDFSGDGQVNQIVNLLNLKRASRDIKVEELKNLNSEIEELEKMLGEIR